MVQHQPNRERDNTVSLTPAQAAFAEYENTPWSSEDGEPAKQDHDWARIANAAIYAYLDERRLHSEQKTKAKDTLAVLLGAPIIPEEAPQYYVTLSQSVSDATPDIVAPVAGSVHSLPVRWRKHGSDMVLEYRDRFGWVEVPFVP